MGKDRVKYNGMTHQVSLIGETLEKYGDRKTLIINFEAEKGCMFTNLESGIYKREKGYGTFIWKTSL